MSERTYKLTLGFLVVLFGAIAVLLLSQIFKPGPDSDSTTEAKSKAEKKTKQTKPEKSPSSKRDVIIQDAPPRSNRSLKKRFERIKSRFTSPSSRKSGGAIHNHTFAFVRAGNQGVPILKKASTHENAGVRSWALQTIGELFSGGNLINKPKRHVSFKQVKSILKDRARTDEDTGVREEAILALGKTGTNEAQTFLRSLKREVETRRLQTRIEFALRLSNGSLQ